VKDLHLLSSRQPSWRTPKWVIYGRGWGSPTRAAAPQDPDLRSAPQRTPPSCQMQTRASQQRAHAGDARRLQSSATARDRYADVAYDLMEPTYGIFMEGFDTSDLKNAKPLLDELDRS
jgi:hypothetical protein